MANLKTTTIDGALIETEGTGTASQVAGAAGAPAVFASAVSAGGATNSRIGICGAGSGKCVIVYGDDGNSDQGTAIVGTVKGTLSGTSITYGTPVVFQSAAGGIETPSVTRIYDYGASVWRILIAYVNNTNKGASIVGTVSGDTITFGTEQTFANHTTIQPKAVAFTQAGSGKVAISYTADTGFSYVIVGTLSGTTMTYGTRAVLPPTLGHGRSNDIAIVPNSPTIVISYRDLSNSNQLTAIAGSVSGTAVTLGTAVVFYATNTTNSPAIANVSYPYNKFIVAWKSSSNVGQACVGTLSGTTISFGTAENFSATAIEGDLAAVWDDDGSVGDGTTEGVIIVYGSGDVDLLRATPVRVTGTNTINIGTTVNGPTCGPSKLGVIYDGHNEKIVSAYVDTAASNYGTAVAWRALPGGNITVDLSTGNYFELDLNDLGNVVPQRIHSFFINNPHTSQVSSFTLQLTQASPHKQFRFDALQDKIYWPGGSGGREVNSVVLLSDADDAVDVLQFTTWDAGTTWYGKIVGKNLSYRD